MDERIRTIAAIFTTHGEEMIRWARRALKRETDAEDVVQDVFLALLGTPHALAGVERLTSWLFTVVQRRSIDFIRREITRRDKEEQGGGIDDVLASSNPSFLMDEEELSQAFADAVGELPEKLRSVFVLNEIEEMTYREISELHGIPMGTLMARKKKAVDMLRTTLMNKGLLSERPTSP